jgi:hypothetical protein
VAQFPSTRWSLIVRSGATPSARHAAFSELALAYRRAILNSFARLAPQDAEDVTQSFLEASYEHAWWSRADASAGTFRGFLLMNLIGVAARFTCHICGLAHYSMRCAPGLGTALGAVKSDDEMLWATSGIARA